MTFPGGTHDLWIRYWLAAGGIDPDKDIETIVVPPPQMVANMKVGTMDCFCVCEPWNLQLIHQSIGYTAITTGELWNKHPEKSLGMRAAYVDKNPNAAKAILMAMMEAQQWCEKPENRAEVARDLRQAPMDQLPVEDIIDRMKGKFDYGIPGKVVENSPHIMKYWNDFASYPFQSHDLWFLTEDIRWGKFEADLDTKALIAKVNREDIWRAAAKELNVPADQIPASTSRGKETFFDGKVFDPDNPAAYLKSLAIKRAESADARDPDGDPPDEHAAEEIRSRDRAAGRQRGGESAAARRAEAPAAEGPRCCARASGSRGERRAADRRHRAHPAGVGAALLASRARRCRRPRAC